MVICGGAGTMIGPFIGALLAIALPEWLRFTGGLYLLIFAACVLVLLVLCPGGILGLGERALNALRRRP